MERPPFKQIVLIWRDECFGGRVPLNSEDRINGFLDLLDTLLNSGYEPFEIMIPSNKGQIVHLCHNPNHRDSKKGKIWQTLVEEDLDIAIGRHPAWPKISVKKFDTDKSNYTPGARPVNKREKSSSAEDISEDTKNPEDVEPSIQELEKAKKILEEELKNTEKSSKDTSDKSESSKKDWKTAPGLPDPAYDEELLILLGLKK